MQKESGYYQQPPGNQMIYSQQIPNLSSSPQQTNQGSLMQTQGRPTYATSTDTQAIRPMVGARMPQHVAYPNATYAQQGQPSDVVTPGYPGHTYHVSAQSQFIQNGVQPFAQTYGNYGGARNAPSYTPLYHVVPQGVVPPGNYGNNVVIAPQMPTSQSHMIQNQAARQPQQHMYTTIPPNNVHSSQSPIVPQQPPQPEVPAPKKRTAIKISDPNTGKDLTSEIFKKKQPPVSAPPVVNPDETIKAQMAALFAAQVAEKIAGSAPPQSEGVTIRAPAPELSTDKVVDPPVDIPDVVNEAVSKSSDKPICVDPSPEVVLQESTSSAQVKDNLDKPVEAIPEVIEEVTIVEVNADIDVDVTIEDQSKEVEAAVLIPENVDTVADIVDKVNDLKLEQNLPKEETNVTQESVSSGKEVVEEVMEVAETESVLETVPTQVAEVDEPQVPEKADETAKETIEPEAVKEEVAVETPTSSIVEDVVVKEVAKEEAIAVAITEVVSVKKEAPLEKEVVTGVVDNEESFKKENSKNEKTMKNEKSLEKEELAKNITKEGVAKLEEAPVREEIRKQPEKEPPKPAKKESSTKEDAVRRFEPAFSSSSESLKGTRKGSAKQSNSPKPSESTKQPELSGSSNTETKAIEPAKKAEVQRVDLSEPMVNGHDNPIKPTTINPVTKKKKGKGRFKEFDAKDNNDMLSAFVDAPKETVSKPEPVKVVEKPPEEATWEDKENSIEKEEIRGEDAEELEVVPKRVETKILKGEGSTTVGKHQYDRDFLLKFQFSPICTSKPLDLPNIDIVLNEAHAPTRALVPGQRLASANDFMPTFMRQGSGGGGGGGGGGGRRNDSGSGGARNSRDKGGRGSQTNPGRPQKVISIPHLEKMELKKSENAWVRPSQKEKEMSGEEKDMYEVDRNVRSILNKLTPQKFKTLVNQMIALKIDNGKKLESAISLIFEKAISEPGFSVAYANMCRVLTDNFSKVPESSAPDAPFVTFRKILLNKCQMEFEKESINEKEFEEERNKKFDTEEETKAHLMDLEYRELMNRRRTMGNIRFIGELYKLKMISEPIMHDCIYKLLRAEKQQESYEEQLECLCKLLTTIGKDIDHEKAKPRVDQYFDQMQKIIDRGKVSSRIKFALRDVMDLRKCSWVPRRDTNNPKTIDQIHREAEQKEKEQEKSRQQDKLQKKLDPRGGRGGGGRDSPSVRTGGNTGPQNADGWNTVSNKSRQIASAPVDASKMRFKKMTDMSEMSLGPGGRPGAWSKGASGGGSGSRSGSSGSNTPTTELDQRANRYDALMDSSVAPGSVDHKGRSGNRQGGMPPIRKGTSGDHSRSEALRAVRDMTGRGSRNQSPAGRGSRNESPATRSSRNQSPATRSNRNESPATRSNRNESPATRSSRNESPSSYGRAPRSPDPVSESKMRKVTKSTIEEFLSCKDEKEAILCIKELNSPAIHNIFVEEGITIAIEKKPEHRHSVGSLLRRMLKEGLLDTPQVCKGLASVVELAPDFAVDIPHIYKYLGEVIGPIVFDNTLPLNKVKDTLEPLIANNKAGIVMAEALSAAVKVAGSEESIASLWSESKITWDKLLDKGENVEQFVKDRKVEFTVNPVPQRTTASLSHASKIQEEMLHILNRSSNDNDELISYIERHANVADRKDPEFIQALATAVCTSSLSRDSSSNCVCRTDILKKRKNILIRYIDASKELELQSLYALQQLVQDLKHPKGLLNTLFYELYEGDVITEETFFAWESSKDMPVGKGPALSSVKGFLTWLRKEDEESNDEESSTSPTNA